MRSIILTAAISTLALVGGVWMLPGAPDVDSDLIVGSITRNPSAPVETLMASNVESGDICLIERSSDPAAGVDLLSPASDCDAVWPGLGGAQRWSRMVNGRIQLIQKDGKAVLTLSRRDALGFRALATGQSLIVLTSLE